MDADYIAHNYDTEPGLSCKAHVYMKELYDCCAYRQPRRFRGDGGHGEATTEREDAGEIKFFSKKEVNKLFSEEVIKILWECPCRRCDGQRRAVAAGGKDRIEDPVFLTTVDANILRNGKMLVALLVFLDRLHLIHSWAANAPTRSSMEAAWDDCLEDGKSRDLPDDFFSGPQRQNFQKYYPQCFPLFSALRIRSGADSLIPYYPEWPRLPFLEEHVLDKNSQNPHVFRISVPAEFLDDSVARRIAREYEEAAPSQSVPANDIRGKRFTLVRKVRPMLRDRSSNELLAHWMEANVNLLFATRIRSVHSNDADEIDPWRHILTHVVILRLGKPGSLQYIFPYVESDLDKVLRGEQAFPGLDAADTALRDKTLWRQMIGICCALAEVHTRVSDKPGEGPRNRIFHFDLKPGNILVTRSGVAKIADFGQALWRRVRAHGDQGLGRHQEGDHEYRAPDAEMGEEFVTQKYDVWQMACIILDVLVFILASPDDLNGRVETLKTFRHARRREPLDPETGGVSNDFRTCFFRPRTTNDDEKDAGNREARAERFKLKDSVQQKLDDLTRHFAMGSDPVQMYMSQLLTLVRQMFEVAADKRPSSGEIKRRLRDMDSVYQASVDTENLLLKNLWLQPVDLVKYREVGWEMSPVDVENADPQREGETGLRSFSVLRDVQVDLLANNPTQTAMTECRVKVMKLKNGKNRTTPEEGTDDLLILWSIRQAGQCHGWREELKSKEAIFIPMYLYEPLAISGRSRYACKIRKKNGTTHVFSFGELRDVLRFQSALMGFKIVYSEEQSFQEVERADKGFRKKRVVCMREEIRAQVWHHFGGDISVGSPPPRSKPFAAVFFQRQVQKEVKPCSFLLVHLKDAADDRRDFSLSPPEGQNGMFEISIFEKGFKVMIPEESKYAGYKSQHGEIFLELDSRVFYENTPFQYVSRERWQEHSLKTLWIRSRSEDGGFRDLTDALAKLNFEGFASK